MRNDEGATSDDVDVSVTAFNSGTPRSAPVEYFTACWSRQLCSCVWNSSVTALRSDNDKDCFCDINSLTGCMHVDWQQMTALKYVILYRMHRHET